jgi:ParB family chromosome partitioning protein
MKRERGSTESLKKLPDMTAPKPDDTYRRLCDALAKSEVDGSVVNITMDHVQLSENIRGKVIKDEEYEALKMSIMAHGLLHPVVIQLINGKPTLVAGYRRWAACVEIGMQKIKATAKAPETEWRIVQIFENLLRSDIPGIKYAEAIKELKSTYPDDTHAQLAARIGLKDRGSIGFYLKAADWPEEIKEDCLVKGMSRRAILMIAKQKESNDETALQEMVADSGQQTEKKERAAAEAGAPTAAQKQLNDVLRQKLILSGVPDKAKSVHKLAEKVAELQPEIRQKLIKALQELDNPF